MSDLSHEAALRRIIEIQRKMIDDFAELNHRLTTVVQVASGLDEEFKQIYFSRLLAYSPTALPASIPTKQELEQALRLLGFDGGQRSGVEWWNSLSGLPNPWLPDGRR